MGSQQDISARKKVRELIKDIKTALMVTQGADGRMHSRPMVAMEHEGDELWFMTRNDSGKIMDIRSHPEVLLSYSEPKDNNYVSMNGRAELVTDRNKIKDIWSEHARTWFPKGPDDPSIILIRVIPESAEYWDAPASAFVYAYGYVKARLTGEMPHPGEVGTAQY